jgi:hypothetical protein
MGGGHGYPLGLTDLEIEVVYLLFARLLVLLYVSTRKKDVIILGVSRGVGGFNIDDGNLESFLMYKAKHRWFEYLKKMEREFWDSLRRQWN